MNYPTSLPHSLLELPLENHDEFQNVLTTKCARLSEDLYGQSSRGLETELANKHSPGLGLSDSPLFLTTTLVKVAIITNRGALEKPRCPRLRQFLDTCAFPSLVQALKLRLEAPIPLPEENKSEEPVRKVFVYDAKS